MDKYSYFTDTILSSLIHQRRIDQTFQNLGSDRGTHVKVLTFPAMTKFQDFSRVLCVLRPLDFLTSTAGRGFKIYRTVVNVSSDDRNLPKPKIYIGLGLEIFPEHNYLAEVLLHLKI